MRDLNNKLSVHLKKIGVDNIKAITDSAISIYNETGIKAAALFDKNIYLVCEYAIPLTYLQELVNEAGKFNYTIKLNGLEVKGGKIMLSGKGRFIIIYGSAGRPPYAIPASPQYMVIAFPTDLKGQYTLIK
jgi:hypothetical protein